MKRLVFVAALALVPAPVSAQPVRSQIERGPSAPIRVELQSIPLGSLVTMLMRDVMRVPYVIAPDVLQDRRPVSVNLVLPRAEVPQRVVSYLRGMGMAVELRGGTVFVTKGGRPVASASPVIAPRSAGRAANIPSGNPLLPARPARPVAVEVQEPIAPTPELPAPVPVAELAIAVVRPAFTDPAPVADALRITFPDLQIAFRQDATPADGEGLLVPLAERLVVSGPNDRVAMAVALVRHLDRPRPSVAVRGVVLEVSMTDAKSSALSLLASVLGGRVTVGNNFGNNSGLPLGDQFVKIAAGGVNLVLSAVAEDSRFHVVAEPTLTAVSGATARINAGSEVPTVGAVSFAEDGTPVRSVVYRQSGVSLRVTPRIRPGEIELTVFQERSSFARTETGVNDSPTLNTSSAASTVVLAPGETVALAGLDERSDTAARQGLFGGLLRAKNRERRESQFVVLLQADLVPDQRTGETVVDLITPASSGV